MARALALDDLHFDALACVCAAIAVESRPADGTAPLKTFSLVSRRVRAAAVPLLFRRVRLEVRTNNGAAETMRTIASATHLTPHVWSLKVLVAYARDELVIVHEDHSMLASPSECPSPENDANCAVLAECAERFVQLLDALANLRGLVLTAYERAANAVGSLFAPAFDGVRLGSVTSLEMSLSHTFLRAACPSVSRLVVRGEEGADEDSENAELPALWRIPSHFITDLSIPSECLSDAADIAACAPCITRLAVAGRLPLHTSIQYLRVFQSLTDLALPPAEKLLLGYRRGGYQVPFFNQQRSHEYDLIMHRLIQERRTNVEQQVKRIVRSGLPGVRILRVGDRTWDFRYLRDDQDMGELDALQHMAAD